MGHSRNNQSSEVISEMQSYCGEDSSIRSVNAALRTRTTEALTSVDAGIDIRSLSFDSLREIYGEDLGMNQELVSIILGNQKVKWNNPQLFEPVEEYFNNSLHMLNLCTALEKRLNRAPDRQLIISVALQRFEEEDGDEASNEQKFSKTMAELGRFRNAEEPFTVEFLRILQTVYGQQRSMLEQLKLHKSKINDKIESIKRMRKLTRIIFVVIVAAVVIGSLVGAAVASSRIAAGLAAAASIPLVSVGTWIDLHWKRRQVELEKQGELISAMHCRTLILDIIQTLVVKLESQIESLMRNADFALRGEEWVKLGIGEIKNNMERFMQSLEDLGAQARNCREHITNGRTMILKKIMNYKK